jgi:holo-[acyl-carrier protein] synthase
MALRVGTDLVLVETVRASLRAHGEHYLQRVYTQREVRDCTGDDGVDPLRLAARFAAKEATLKVLRPIDEGIAWSSIEVVRDCSGWVGLELSGPAAELADGAGIGDLALSVSHEGAYATAVVIACVAQGSTGRVR